MPIIKNKKIINIFYNILLTVGTIIMSIIIRGVFFKELGKDIPFLTFYPAIAIVAIFGTFYAGLITTITSFLLIYLWVAQKSLSAIEWRAMVLFFISSILISIIGGKKTAIEKSLKQTKQELEESNTKLSTQNKEQKRHLDEVKKIQKILEEKTQNLEKMNKLMIGRELMMVELKKEIVALKEKLGQK